MSKRPRLLQLALVWMSLTTVVHAGHESTGFSIYLVRHAEKETAATDLRDPPLSPCGELRAGALATMLKDVELERVYSTPYERTRMTASAVADSHQLVLETYDPRNLEGFAALLLESQQHSLVVGHSNTTGVLAALLAGEAGEEFGEDEYDRLYVVTRFGNRGKMILLNQAFNCQQQ
ncbi:MAG: histidine phosphatase family protein [Xanthomonadales bacterium]|nr:histidine phosphatase family protein [Gammaproteobacteria bacterium]MBT8053500.1 histidine phosphatase family protein [Gammaproteobacteria bacterium]NND55868.1 histidine phosphatase family protein [Xanthomonadales bacterium]NNK50912.1 histidine phosphatase family protein [Xanthomonadales bacterium]